jgi:hypothetical protein
MMDEHKCRFDRHLAAHNFQTGVANRKTDFCFIKIETSYIYSSFTYNYNLPWMPTNTWSRIPNDKLRSDVGINLRGAGGGLKTI